VEGNDIRNEGLQQLAFAMEENDSLRTLKAGCVPRVPDAPRSLARSN
jgi:hypothetical protein